LKSLGRHRHASADGGMRRGRHSATDTNTNLYARQRNDTGAVCPGILAAVGSRTTGQRPHSICGLPTSAGAPAALPRVYIYRFMDELHDILLQSRSSQSMLDPWHQHNQFLSEYAFHRSLLASSLVTNDKSQASLFFVPFYSRMAFSNRSIKSVMLNQLGVGLRSSANWRRSQGRDHMLVVSSTRPMEQLFGAQLALISRAILLKIELADHRHASSARRSSHVAIPYFVPWLRLDEASHQTPKPYSVCLESSNHGKLRSQLFSILRHFPDAYIKQPLDSRKPWRLSRSLLCESRQRMRKCKFCLIPAGLTPTSRRFYEAIAVHCIPVLISDRFVIPYAVDRALGRPGLLSDDVIDSFVIRVPETDIKSLPHRLSEAIPKQAAMMKQLRAYRSAFLYELPFNDQPPAMGAACALIADITRRFNVQFRPTPT